MKKGKKKEKKFNWGYTFGFLILILAVVLFFGYTKSGFFQRDKIDEKDLVSWNYSDGKIVGTDAIEIHGDKKVCWLLIHSYCATPLEMKELAYNISEAYGDYVYVPLLEGHGEVPSAILDLSLNEWYLQVEQDFERLNLECESVNVVGSSFGGALATRLSEEKDFKNLYVVNGYFYPSHKWFYVLPLNFYVNIFGDLLVYSKKTKKDARINDPEGLERHITYKYFPLIPLKNSNHFLSEVMNEFEKVDESVLILHSRGDEAANPNGALTLFDNSVSEDKELFWLDESNHIIFMDYNRDDAIKLILEFEGVRR